MANYAPAFGLDKNTYPYTDAPITSVVAAYNNENGATSSVYSLTHNTTMIEVAAIGASAALRWVRTGDGTGTATSVITAQGSANYNNIIPSGTVRTFVVPKEVIGSSGASIQGANRAEGLFQRVALKGLTAGSVMLVEYGSGGY